MQENLDTAVDAVDAVDIGIEAAICAETPQLLPGSLLVDTYKAALPPRSLSGAGMAAFSGSKEAMQEEGSNVDMLVPELAASLHLVAAAPGLSNSAAHGQVPLHEIGITMGALHQAVQALQLSSLVAVGVLPPFAANSVTVDDRHLQAWSVSGACSIACVSEATAAKALGAGSDTQANIAHTLLQGCVKTVQLVQLPSAGEVDVGAQAALPLHSLGLTQYHPWLLRVVIAPPADSTAKVAVAAIDLGIQVSEQQLDTCTVGDLLRAITVAALSRTQHLRLELREPRSAMYIAHELLKRSAPGPDSGEGGAGGAPTPPLGCALPLGALTPFHASSKDIQQLLLGGNVPLGSGDAAAVMGSGIWGMAGLGSWGKAWSAPAALAGLPLPAVASEAELPQVLTCGDVARVGAHVSPLVPIGAVLLALLEGKLIGVYSKNASQARGGSATASGPGAALQILSDQLTAIAMMLLPLLPAGGTATWCQLPFQIAAIIPQATHTYVSRKQAASSATALIAESTPGAAEFLAALPSSFATPPPLPDVQPHTGPAPTDLNQLKQSLLQRGSMLVVLQGRNFALTDHLDSTRPGLTLELPDSTTVAQLLAALGSAAESTDPAMRSFADSSHGAPAHALWLERGFWSSHVPGDVLDEEEGRRRKPGYFGLERSHCGGGGGIMERAAHFGMRLLDLGVPRMHGVLSVADLRCGHPDTTKGVVSALAAAAASGGSK